MEGVEVQEKPKAAKQNKLYLLRYVKAGETEPTIETYDYLKDVQYKILWLIQNGITDVKVFREVNWQIRIG